MLAVLALKHNHTKSSMETAMQAVYGGKGVDTCSTVGIQISIGSRWFRSKLGCNVLVSMLESGVGDYLYGT